MLKIMNHYQKNLFSKEVTKITKAKTILSVGYNQHEIIQDILNLYCNGKNIDCDPTYSRGNFYKHGIKNPKYCFDLNPQKSFVIKASADKLSLENNSIEVLIFDPPFICGKTRETTKTTGIMRERFFSFKNVPELLRFYESAIIEFNRILKPKGILIFKCQDIVDGGKNYMIHCDVINMTRENGFKAKDLFVLFKHFRIIDPHIKEQRHARKFHSYFLVFEKSKIKETK